MESETASSVEEQSGGLLGGGGGGGGGSGSATPGASRTTRGKHRILAELKRVEQEIKFLEEELEELENTENLSTLCAELLHDVGAMPDPLLAVTNGPANPLWDRWFEGPQDNQGCRCWFL